MGRVTGLLLAVTILIASVALAGDDPLKLVMRGNKVVTETKGGKTVEKLAELPDEVAFGDRLQYTVDGTNTSDKALKNVSVVCDVPEGTAYVDKSMKGPEKGKTLVSIDGGKSYAEPPIMEKVKMADGKVKEVVVPAERYTNFRLVTDELGAKKKFSYTYRVTVK